MKRPKVNDYGLYGWRLPKATYKRARWLVADYPRIKTDYENLLTDSHAHDGPIRSGAPGDPTAIVASKRARLASDLQAVEKAFKIVPEEYVQAVYNHLTEGVPFPDWGNPNTWYEWQRRVLYYVAMLSGY